MSASVAALAGGKPRQRSFEGRRAGRQAKFERERLIVDYLNRGVSIAEIAGRLGVTEKRMRALVRESLARRAPPAPEEYAAIQASRLNEALLVAYGAMSPGNLKAVALVVRIVRELDRYHGFVADGRRPRRGAAAEAEPARLREKAPGDSRPDERKIAAPSPADGSQTAPQALEKPRSAPENDGFAAAPDEAPPASGASHETAGAEGSDEAAPPLAVAQASDLAAAATLARGAEMAPEAIENVDSAPHDSAGPTAAEAPLAPRPDDLSAACAPIQAPPTAGALDPDAWNEALAPTVAALVADPAVPGGFRRVKMRMLRNGWAVCGDESSMNDGRSGFSARAIRPKAVMPRHNSVHGICLVNPAALASPHEELVRR